MKKIYTLAALAMVAIVACNKEIEAPKKVEDENDQEIVVPQGEDSILADASAITKTSVDGLAVKWATGDHIAVFDASKGKHDFELATGAGETSATFTGSMGGNEEIGYAVYPYSSYSAMTDGPVFSMDYASTYTYDAVKVPMIGTKSAGKYAFSHVGGAFKISYTDVPSAATSFTFKSTADYITGTAAFDGADSVIMDNEGDEVWITDVPSSSNLDFIIPVPAEATGTDYTFSVELLDDNLDPIPGSSKTVSSAKNVQLGHLKPLKAISMKAAKDETLWSEDFGNYNADDVPTTGEGSGWRDCVIDYSVENGGSTTKVYNQNTAGGTKPEILVGQNNGTFKASNIPTAGWTTFTVTYYTTWGH